MYCDPDIEFSMYTTFPDLPEIQVSRVQRNFDISVTVHWKKKSFGGYSSSVPLYQQAKCEL